MPVTAQVARGCAMTIKDAGGDKALTGLIDATWTQTMETIDVSEISDIDRKFVPGIRTGTISGNFYYDQNDANFAILEPATKNGYATGSTYYEILIGWHANASYRCKVVFTEWTVTASSQDVLRASFSAQVHDVVTIA